MAVFTQVAASVCVDTMNLAGFCDELELSASADEKDVTTFTAGGWRTKIAGLAQSSLKASGFQDYATTGVDVQFPISGIGGASVQTVSVGAGTAIVVGDPAFMSSGFLNEYEPLSGAVGDPARFSFGWAGNGRLVRGANLHPSAARTASGNGTAVAFVTPTATQSLFASFHILSVTGAGTITLTVQTDDNAGFTTPTTRITSTAFAAVGRQFTSLAGALAGETHVRVIWTIAGFTSVTFEAAAGVAPTSTL